MNKVSIVISSCDKYSYLWDIQMQFFEKYWNDCPYEIHLISDTIKYPYSDFGKLKVNSFVANKTPIGPEDWSNNLLSFLQICDSEYILYFQEDYVPYKKVDQCRLEKLIQYAQNNQINYIRFYTSPPGNGESLYVDNNISIKEIYKNSQWRNSLMLSLWNKNTLMEILHRVNPITPWNFEKSNASHEYDKFYCIDLPKNDSSDIINFYGMYGSSNGYSFYDFIIDLINRENIKKLNGDPIDFSILL